MNTEYFKADTQLKNTYLDFKAQNERKLTEDIIKSTRDTTALLIIISAISELEARHIYSIHLLFYWELQ